MNKTEIAYTTLRGRILDGTYAPGQRLILSTVADELQVSSVPVREALRRLEAEGWVTFRPNIGAEVRPVHADDWADVMEVLALTEGRAIALAAPHLTADDLARAAAHNDEMRQAVERFDPAAASAASRAFHVILMERCPNAFLRRLVAQTSERIDAMRNNVFISAASRTRAVMEEHDTLLRLIEQGADPGVIERYATEHKRQTIAAYTAAREQAPQLNGQPAGERTLAGAGATALPPT